MLYNVFRYIRKNYKRDCLVDIVVFGFVIKLQGK